MSQPVLNLFLQREPASLEPSRWVRRVDTAIAAGAFAATAVYMAISAALWHTLPAPPDGGWLTQALAYPGLVAHTLTLGLAFPHAIVDNPAAGELASLHLRLGPALGAGLAAGWAVLKAGLTPHRRIRHLGGPQLLEREAAVRAAVRVSGAEVQGDPFLRLGPLTIDKGRATRGMLLYGSPGSGKTVVLLQAIEQLIAAGHRAFLYDVKGDLTSYYLGGSVGLICPSDRRSLVWDIGRDCCTPSDAQVFSSSLIKEDEGSGKFWSVAARQLLEGVLRSLQNDHGTNWGWKSLADRLAVDAEAMSARMNEDFPEAVALVADTESSATSSVLATLSSYTKLVGDLAMAWGDGQDPRTGDMRPAIALTDWAADGYEGDIRQLIFQAGPDRTMTTALGSAMLNLLTPRLLSAGLPDDERGRTIAIVLDELPSIGKIDFMSLIERGRSKGVIFLAAVQTLDQVKAVWGEETMRSLGSMIGTHIVFRCQASASRDAIAEQFGKSRWAVTSINTSGGNGQGMNANVSVHEEQRPVIQPYELTDSLGPQKGKRFPLGWGIRAMVAGVGPDVLQLDFDGVSPRKRRTPHRAARWTTQPAGKAKPKPVSEGRAATPQGGAAQAPGVVPAKTREDYRLLAEARKAMRLAAADEGEPFQIKPQETIASSPTDSLAKAAQQIRDGADDSPLASIVASAVGTALGIPGIELVEHAADALELIEGATGEPGGPTTVQPKQMPRRR